MSQLFVTVTKYQRVFKEGRIYLVLVFRGYSDEAEHHGGKEWRKKPAHLRAARKQREGGQKRKVWGQDLPIKGTPTNGLLPPTRSAS